MDFVIVFVIIYGIKDANIFFSKQWMPCTDIIKINDCGQWKFEEKQVEEFTISIENRLFEILIFYVNY